MPIGIIACRCPGLFVPQVGTLAAGEQVILGTERLTPTGTATVAGRECVTAEVSTTFGRQGTLAIETATGLVVRREQTVVLGRGDRFSLTLELQTAQPLDAAATAGRQTLLAELKELASVIHTDDRETDNPLPPALLEAADALMPKLTSAAADSPIVEFVASVARDLAAQRQRQAALAAQQIGKPAPLLMLTGLDGKPLDPQNWAGKVLVLHFWEYDYATLEAPLRAGRLSRFSCTANGGKMAWRWSALPCATRRPTAHRPNALPGNWSPS